MSTKQERIRVFQDTINWFHENDQLKAAIAFGEAHTTVFYEDEYMPFQPSQNTKMNITVTHNRSFQAALSKHIEHPQAKIAVLNFANAFSPGGGVVNGAGAQEECLCRISTLYPLLHCKHLISTFYQHHRKLNSPKATDSLVYTEGVVVCKTDEDLPKRLQEADWITVDVITMAAPDLRTRANPYFSLAGKGLSMSDAELFGYHVKRAIHMLTIAAFKKVDILILGAFGCGAFQNNPKVVANAYKTALTVFPNVFKEVEFAIYCPPGNLANYDAFREVLMDPKDH